jgi:outer membrane protein assembly factor BamD (BamD/ComL family)
MSYRIKVPAKVDPLDETHLLSGIERFLLGLQEQRRALLVGFGVLLVAAAVVIGVIWYDHQTALKARELDQDATLHYLNRPADDPKKAHEQLTQAINLYKQVVDQYPRTPVAPLALFHLGNAQVLNNEVDAGIETYKRFMLLYNSNPSLLGLVQQRLAYAHLVKEDRDQAAKAFAGVLEIPGALNKDYVLFELAKMEESQSRPEGALAHYQDLMKNYPNSPFTSEAAVRVKVLEVKQAPESQPGGSTPAPAANASVPQPESPGKSSGKHAAPTSKKKP